MASFGIGAQLVWDNGERPPFALNKVITTLGRNESNDIFLDDPKVSSFHGNILNREDGFHLMDLKSRNGTLVNGKPVTACALRDGDAIAFGDIQLKFKALTPFPKTPMPLARLNQKIHTMAIQSPGLRKEAEEILREVERHQEFLKSLVETVSALTASRTVGHFAEKLADILSRKLDSRSVSLGAERVQDLPRACALQAAAWDASEAKAGAGGNGRWLKVSSDSAGWRVQLAFEPAPGTRMDRLSGHGAALRAARRDARSAGHDPAVRLGVVAQPPGNRDLAPQGNGEAPGREG